MGLFKISLRLVVLRQLNMKNAARQIERARLRQLRHAIAYYIDAHLERIMRRS